MSQTHTILRQFIPWFFLISLTFLPTMPGCSCLAVVPPANFKPDLTGNQGRDKSFETQTETPTDIIQEDILETPQESRVEKVSWADADASQEEPVLEVKPEPVLEEPPQDPCQPSPCHEKATCQHNNGQAVCTCIPGYRGNGFQCESIAATLDGLRWELPCGADWPDYKNVCLCQQSAETKAQLKGVNSTLYDITIRFRGVVETKKYTGGSNDGNYWQVGGQPNGDNWNIYRLTISNPKQTFYLNRGKSGLYYCFGMDYTKTVKAYGGAEFALYADSIEKREIKNIDANDKPILIPDVKPYPLPYKGQFVQMDIIKIQGSAP